jgi:predicted nucleic acid-binding protein
VYCIDASVLTAVFDENYRFHQGSLEFLESIIESDIEIIMPAFALVELAGATIRKGYRTDDIINYLNLLKGYRNTSLLPLTMDLCELAVDVAIQLKVKGSDSIYIAVSQSYNLKLITNDRQQRERGSIVIASATPEEELTSIREQRQ